MIITVNRQQSDDKCVQGVFLVDNPIIKDVTLERPWMDGQNVHGQSCILPGTFEVIITFSPHFGKMMPLLLNVVGRDEIRIHPANWPYQLEGCIAIGSVKAPDAIYQSDAAFNIFLPALEEALKVGKVFITINNVF